MIQRLFSMSLVLLLFITALAAPSHALEPLQDEQILEVIRSHPQEILDSLIKYQQQESQSQLEKQSQKLQDLTSDRTKFLSNSARKGPIAAQRTIVEFSDFQCPFCNPHSALPEGQKIIMDLAPEEDSSFDKQG